MHRRSVLIAMAAGVTVLIAVGLWLRESDPGESPGAEAPKAAASVDRGQSTPDPVETDAPIEPAEPPQRSSAARRRDLDERILRRAGLSSEEVARIRDQAQAAAEECEHRRKAASKAARGGKRKKRKRRLAPTELEAVWAPELELQAALGPDTYDLMLKAAGERNRVHVAWIGGRSSAAKAGLKQGDIIVSYNRQEVFKAGPFQVLERRVTPGETVHITYLRGDQLHTAEFTAARRPLQGKGLVDGFRVK